MDKNNPSAIFPILLWLLVSGIIMAAFQAAAEKTGQSMLILMSTAHQQQEQACREHGFKGLKYCAVHSKILSRRSPTYKDTLSVAQRHCVHYRR